MDIAQSFHSQAEDVKASSIDLRKVSHEECNMQGVADLHACEMARSGMCVANSWCPVIPSRWLVLPAVSVLAPDESMADGHCGSHIL